MRVTVEQAEAAQINPYSFSLVRWILDPALAESTEELDDSMMMDDGTSTMDSSAAGGTGDVAR